MREFQGPNAGYILELYERYCQDPGSVDPAARAFFAGWTPPGESRPLAVRGEPVTAFSLEQAVGVANLAQSIRSYGHLAARLDPLGSPPPGDPSLDPAQHGLSEADLRNLPAELVGGPLLADISPSFPSAFEALEALRSVYSATTGYDYSHILVPEERDWLRAAAETRRYRPAEDAGFDRCLLERLTQVEVFERFLQRSFPGKTRFSIEGLDMLVPLLDEIVSAATENGICVMVLGMAHRGRLNVLAHILQKPYAQILAEFKDPGQKPTAWQELGWLGDVKYHRGASLAVTGGESVQVVIGMPANPSHLEFINPVIEGMARAADCAVDQPGPPRFFPKAAMPVLIHGDASFPGEGVVTETLNLAYLPGYYTAGTIHIIANNQLGYTATPNESRSSPYASDFARGLKIPILHVNSDDVLACLEAVRTACAYRDRFQKDVLIDLVGYRRYGHNEGDEPAFTQPVMYRQIHDHPTVRAQWAARLVAGNMVESGEPDRLVQQGLDALQAELDGLNPTEVEIEPNLYPPEPGAARRVLTGVPIERLAELNTRLLDLPEGFQVNRKLVRERERRRGVFSAPTEPGIDWALAEALAFGSLLEEGIAIRLTGQDAIRGTFSQRHVFFYDEQNGQPFSPLQSLPGARASFEAWNSPLTESAALGFEFGYNIQAPDRLVLWEAQYGDFVNVAQAMIDEFILSARAKWGQTPSLMLLLPHGNEGQGPDHSSARPERFLQLAAEINLRIAYPTSAAQYFHLLRRQALLLKTDPLPLVVFTPKGLLRHPKVTSCPVDLVEGGWKPVLVDHFPGKDGKAPKRLLLCTGRIYVDLTASPRLNETGGPGLILARLEQLYPFPAEELKAVLAEYPSLSEVTWVQEEPGNMGAWEYVRPKLADLLGKRVRLGYIGRPPGSSPAEGSTAWYAANQKAIVETALSPKRKGAGDLLINNP